MFAFACVSRRLLTSIQSFGITPCCRHHDLAALQIGLLETGRSRPVFKQFWRSDSAWRVQVLEQLGLVVFSQTGQSTSWHLKFRAVDVKFAVRSKNGPILCFSTSPRVFLQEEYSSERVLDTTLGGELDARLLPTFHHYLLDLHGEKADSLLDLLSRKWRVKLLETTDERDLQVLSDRTAIQTMYERFETQMKKLQEISFQVAYLAEHLIARDVLHPESVPDVLSAINIQRVPVNTLIGSLQGLPQHLFQCLDLGTGLPPLHATASHLQHCIEATASKEAASGGGGESAHPGGSVRYSRIDYSAASHWADKLPIAPPDWKSVAGEMEMFGAQTFDFRSGNDQRFMLVRRAFVTPLSVKIGKEQFELSNRVIRKHWQHRDRFLRVKFCDESLQWPATSKEAVERIDKVLKEGIDVAGRHYEVLAFSANQLRQYSAWFFAPTDDLTTTKIIEGLGDFSNLPHPSKAFARLGQCFSATFPVRTVDNIAQHTSTVEDVERNGYIFSDGVGQISLELAQATAEALYGNMNYGYATDEDNPSVEIPSAFQIRYGGYKGVVTVCPSLEGRQMKLRPSMDKFLTSHSDLEVIRAAERMPGYLNRQFIVLLSALGIQDGVFEEMKEETMLSLEKINTDPNAALHLLHMHGCQLRGNPLNSVLQAMRSGIPPSSETFLEKGLLALAQITLRNLRDKSSIPVEKSAYLMGVMDEENVLEEGEIFVAVRDPKSQTVEIITGDVIVGKNPCYHPGDIRKLKAVDQPLLHHLVDCLVFPQRGKRPHPNECGGSDLDGDVYFVSWDNRLVFQRNAAAADYTPPIMDTKHVFKSPRLQDGLADFFTSYLQCGTVGVISNSHLAHADLEAAGANSDVCKTLAHLYSIAVDFPKTGCSAQLSYQHYPRKYPDFMQHQGTRKSYRSQKVLGKLFRSVQSDIEQERLSHLDASTVAPWNLLNSLQRKSQCDYMDDATNSLRQYSQLITVLMDHFHVDCEAKLLAGLIDPSGSSADVSSNNLLLLGQNYWHDLRYLAQMETNLLINRFYRTVFLEGKSNPYGDAWLENEQHFLAKASAWYMAAYTESTESKPRNCLSFPWIAHRQLCYLKRKHELQSVARMAL